MAFMAGSVGVYKPGNEMIVAECPKRWRDLVYVEYPGTLCWVICSYCCFVIVGIIENEEKAFETLGGMKTSTKVKHSNYLIRIFVNKWFIVSTNHLHWL